MDVVEHGEWEVFKPDPHPEFHPANMMFFRRKEDGADWYQYLKKNFQDTSIKMTCWQRSGIWVVQAVVKEADRLIPIDALVLELTGVDVTDPQSTFGQKVYDQKTKTFLAKYKRKEPTVDIFTDDESTLGIDYIKHVPAIIRELKALRKRISELEAHGMTHRTEP
jgi:hypothetical protein